MVRRLLTVVLFCSILLAALTSCAPAGKGGDMSDHAMGMKMAALSDMPAEVQAAPASVQDAYRFNVANPELMKQIPCYCGCGSMGHTSNYDCYVKSVDGDKITFDQHALGCGICVDITKDAMRLSAEGKTAAEIKAYIDQTYSQYGPSNIP